MPQYKTESDLPKTVQEVLPKHGQKIYKEAFYSALEQYDQPKERESNRSREETSHAVAWNAVKNVYHKNQNGEWVKDTNDS